MLLLLHVIITPCHYYSMSLLLHVTITPGHYCSMLLLSASLRSNGADYVLLLFFLFTICSQKLLDRFSHNFQELCILG